MGRGGGRTLTLLMALSLLTVSPNTRKDGPLAIQGRLFM